MRGMDGDTLYSIGDLARRTGLSVRTIRFYSDRGLLPPTSRSPAGYRRYDLDAQARLVLADLVGRYAQTFGKADTPDYRSKLLIRLQIAIDPRVERYWHLLATINGWPIPPTLAPVFEWFIQALRHHPDPTTTRA
jgi:hypothetical protein